MKPWLHQTAGKYKGQVKFVAVDVDKNQDVAEEYKVEFMPTLVLMKGNQEVDRIVGADKNKILSMISEAL